MLQSLKRKIFIKPRLTVWLFSAVVIINLISAAWMCERYYSKMRYLNVERVVVQSYLINIMLSTSTLTEYNIKLFQQFFADVNKLSNISLTTSVAPRYENRITNVTCQLSTFYTSKIDYKCQPLLDSLPKYNTTVHVSYYMEPLKKWLNITIANPQVPVVALLSLGLEMILVMIFLSYMISTNNLTKAWERIRASAQKLGVKLPSDRVPKSGPTVIRHAALAMDCTLLRLDQLVKERITIMASLSHDIRTPLTKAQLYTEMSENEDLQKKILPQLNLINELLSETLGYAREDHFTEELQYVDLVSLMQVNCEEMIDTGRAVIFSSAIAYFKSYVQPKGVQRALANLINNALFYGDQANVAISREKNSLRVVIEDNGPGIPESEMEKVFEPFYRFESSRSKQTGGTGLGLAIAKSIIEFNKGRILLANLPSGGLQVTLLFNSVA